MSRVHVVLPGNVDDPRSPSGGNTYGRRVANELATLGWTVARHRVPGSWPRPSAAEEAGLARLLAAVPDGEIVLLDGLVACGVPEVVAPHAGRVRVVVLVHLPLADEAGLPADVAADLDARERATLRAADAIVVPSAAAARRLARDVRAAKADPAGRRTAAGSAARFAADATGPPADADSGSRPTDAGPAAGLVASTAGPSARRARDTDAAGAEAAAFLPVFIAEPGTDPAPWAAGTDGASALLCVAAVTPVKGHDVLVDALAAVADRPWTCVCAGPLDRAPDHVADVRRRIARAGLADRIRLVGPLDPDARDAAYVRRRSRRAGLADRDLRDGRRRGARPRPAADRDHRRRPSRHGRPRPGRHPARPARPARRRGRARRRPPPLVRRARAPRRTARRGEGAGEGPARLVGDGHRRRRCPPPRHGP